MAYEKKYFLQDFTPDVAVGIKIPFTGVKGNLFDLSYSTEQQVLSNVKNLILTNRGERVMQPRFGTNIRKSLFNQNTDDIKEQIAFEITDAIGFWLPYVNVTDLKVELVVAERTDIQEHGVKITLRVAVNGLESEVPLTFLITQSTSVEI